MAKHSEIATPVAHTVLFAWNSLNGKINFYTNEKKSFYAFKHITMN